jgi:hypothetical protein
VVSEKKHFESFFPIGSNVKLCPAIAAILNFISEQINLKIVEDHPMNIHVQFGFNDMATAGLSLTLDPIGKMFQNASTIETNLPRNDHWKVLYKVSVFYADQKSKMATTTGHRLKVCRGPSNEHSCTVWL